MIDLIAAAGIGGIIGFGTCAVLTMAKVADGTANEEMLEVMTRRGVAVALELVETQDAHTRCADALGTTQRKLSAIRDLLDTPRTIRKGDVALILDGEQG